MTGRYNRTKGHNYERQITKELKKIFLDAVTSRAGARGEDPNGIDIINTGMFNIQTKAREHLNLFEILGQDMPENSGINIVFWKRNRKSDIVAMNKTDFYKILEILRREHVV